MKDFAPNCPLYVQILKPENKFHVKFAGETFFLKLSYHHLYKKLKIRLLKIHINVQSLGKVIMPLFSVCKLKVEVKKNYTLQIKISKDRHVFVLNPITLMTLNTVLFS